MARSGRAWKLLTDFPNLVSLNPGPTKSLIDIQINYRVTVSTN